MDAEVRPCNIGLFYDDVIDPEVALIAAPDAEIERRLGALAAVESEIDLGPRLRCTKSDRRIEVGHGG